MNKVEKYQRLTALQDEIIDAYVADTVLRGAEDYAPLYRKYSKLFKQLVKSEIATDKGLRKYFRGLAERAIELMDWNEYEQRIASATPGAVYKAGILDYLVKAFWENETLVLKIALTGTLMDALEAGGLYTEEDLGVDVEWSRNGHEAIDFLNKYSASLAKGLTEVSQKRIYSVIKEGLENHEDREQVSARINDVVKDPRRATTIAQTESVRAFSEGRMHVAKQIGADRKRWRTAGATDFCLTFEGLGVVPLTYRYLTEQGGKVDKPPGHPNCRCGIEIFMPEEKV